MYVEGMRKSAIAVFLCMAAALGLWAFCQCRQTPSPIKILPKTVSRENVEKAKILKARAEKNYENRRTAKAALQEIDQAICTNPLDSDAYGLRAKILTFLGRRDDGIRALSERVALFPNDAMAYAVRAAYEGNHKNYSAAITDNSKAISLDPNFGHAYLNLAWDYLDTKQYDKGLVEVERAIPLLKESDERAMSLWIRADLRRSVGNRAGALGDYSAAISMKPFAVDAILTKRAQCRFELGDFKGALADCNLAHNKFSPDSDNEFLRSRVHFALGQHTEAAADLSTLVSAIVFPYVLLLGLTLLGNCPFFLLLALFYEHGVPPPIAR